MMTATLCPSADRLRALTLGQLPDEHSDELFEHLRNCEACCHELEKETTEDSQDSLIASLRGPDGFKPFDGEPDCKVAMAKALGSLALASDNMLEDGQDANLLSKLLPKRIGEYEIVRALGQGGMGSVFLARHTKLGRQVALKILASHRLADLRTKERFEAEMRAVGRLSHPNVVAAHDARDVDGLAVLITEFIDGLDLGQLLQRTGPLPVAEACELARQVATALEYTHQQGFVHRDVKPSNVMLSNAGEVKLLDLGLARLQYADNQPAEITGTGQTMGTADYVAPEQVTDCRNVDVRADIYSLGCTLFKLLTGAAPFSGENHGTAFAKMTAHVSTAAPSLGDCLPNAPLGLVRLVDSMLAKQPALRPQTPRDVSERLSAFTQQADLLSLAERASKLPPAPKRVETLNSSGAKTTPSKKSVLQRSVPMYVAIAAGLLGTLLGICMGIVITIINPDGTKTVIKPPDGSQVLVEDSANNPPPAAVGQANPLLNQNAQYPAPERLKLPTGPLFFAVLVANDADPSAIEAAKQALVTRLFDPETGTTALESESFQNELRKLFTLQMLETEQLQSLGKEHPIVVSTRKKIVQMKGVVDKLRAGDRILDDNPPFVVTNLGAWYPLDSNVNAPIETTAGGVRYGLVNLQPSQLITWSELTGNLSMQISGNTHMQLFFDPPLSNRLEDVSGRNIDGHMAIIFNDRIITAPRINSKFGRSADFTGKLSSEEVRYLMQCLNGGLVEPLRESAPTGPERFPSKPQSSTKTPAKVFNDAMFRSIDTQAILDEVQRVVDSQRFDARDIATSVTAAVKPAPSNLKSDAIASGFQELELLKSLREVHRDLPSNGQWLAGNEHKTYRFKVNYEFLMQDMETVVDTFAGQQGVLREVLEGIRKDPNGPQVDIATDILPYLGDEITILQGSAGSASQGQIHLLAFSLKAGTAEPGTELLAAINRLMEKQPGNARQFYTLQLEGDYLLLGSSEAVEQAVARHATNSETSSIK